MNDTANLHLPYLSPGQAQKHVTVNETIRKLDAIVQLTVASATTTAQPESPSDGDVYIVPSAKTGAQWSAFAEWSLGYYRDGAWEQIAPREGWLAFVKDTDSLLHWTGATWALFAPGKLLTVSATDTLLGRSTAGAGAAEEIACTAAGRALLDDASASAQRTTLGLGTAATKNTGTSGNNVPLLDGGNTWSGSNLFSYSFGINGAAIPGSFWSTGNGGIFHRLGMLASCGSFALGLYSNGYRNSGGTWTSLNVNGQTGAAAVELLPTGDIVIRADTSVSGASPAERIRYAISSETLEVGGIVRPKTDNARTLGAASYRWSTVYAGSGTINTSDAREKTALRPLAPAETRAVRRILKGVGVFRWLSAMDAKGEAARLHVGVTAQDVAAAFEAEGLDPAAYALWCADPVMETVETDPERFIPARPAVADPETGEVLEPEAPAQVMPAVRAERPVLDPRTGEPLVRLGVRHDQLFALALGALFQP